MSQKMSRLSRLLSRVILGREGPHKRPQSFCVAISWSVRDAVLVCLPWFVRGAVLRRLPWSVCVAVVLCPPTRWRLEGPATGDDAWDGDEWWWRTGDDEGDGEEEITRRRTRRRCAGQESSSVSSERLFRSRPASVGERDDDDDEAARDDAWVGGAGGCGWNNGGNGNDESDDNNDSVMGDCGGATPAAACCWRWSSISVCRSTTALLCKFMSCNNTRTVLLRGTWRCMASKMAEKVAKSVPSTLCWVPSGIVTSPLFPNHSINKPQQQAMLTLPAQTHSHSSTLQTMSQWLMQHMACWPNARLSNLRLQICGLSSQSSRYQPSVGTARLVYYFNTIGYY